MEVCATQEESETNIAASFSRGYEPFALHNLLDMKGNGRAVHICGAGPSIEDTFRSIPAGEDIIAANSAIPFLLDHGVVPRYAMIWDASPLLEKFAVPHPDITYLIASRCDTGVFKRLAGCNVIVWHAGGDYEVEQVLVQAGKLNEPMVNGGSAAVTRGLYLAYAMGYRGMHLHGADSSYRGDQTHVRGSLVPEKRLRVVCHRQWFDTTPEWAAQVEEFKCIFPAFREMGVPIVAHGDGLLPHVCRALNESFARRERAAESAMTQQLRSTVATL